MTRDQERPSLYRAQFRVIHASRRLMALGDLVDVLRRAAEEDPARMTFPSERYGADPDETSPTFHFHQPDPKRLRDARMLASEVIHHLRTALDYLAYQLVWLDRGFPHEQSAFPMCTKSRYWKGALSDKVPGLTAAHQHRIKKLQPFEKCRWIAQLQELSNSDKHRFVIDMHAEQNGNFLWSPKDAVPDPQDPGKYVLEVEATPLTLQLADGTGVIETLSQLCENTAHLLNSFLSDFGETNHLVARAVTRP